VATPGGLLAVARELEGSALVWSAEHGYPADQWYLDHHADVGWTESVVRRHFPLPAGGGPVGVRLHRVTGRDAGKAPYDPAAAEGRVAAHAAHFVEQAALRALDLGAAMDRPPLLVHAFDAELFGHWWAEGPAWLAAVLRLLASHPNLAARTPTDDVRLHPVVQRVQPAPSSWGAGGHHGVWLDTATAPAHLELARLGDVLRRLAPGRTESATWRAAARHLLLAQASDWTFMVTRGTSAPYGRRRLETHLGAAERLCDALRRGTAPEPADVGDERPFPALDLRPLEHGRPLSGS
jgi:1,4-alpha-glucan branching enzyme